MGNPHFSAKILFFAPLPTSTKKSPLIDPGHWPYWDSGVLGGGAYWIKYPAPVKKTRRVQGYVRVSWIRSDWIRLELGLGSQLRNQHAQHVQGPSLREPEPISSPTRSWIFQPLKDVFFQNPPAFVVGCT